MLLGALERRLGRTPHTVGLKIAEPALGRASVDVCSLPDHVCIQYIGSAGLQDGVVTTHLLLKKRSGKEMEGIPSESS